jgi:hypothetical protein
VQETAQRIHLAPFPSDISLPLAAAVFTAQPALVILVALETPQWFGLVCDAFFQSTSLFSEPHSVSSRCALLLSAERMPSTSSCELVILWFYEIGGLAKVKWSNVAKFGFVNSDIQCLVSLSHHEDATL